MRVLSWIFLILTIAAVALDWAARGQEGAMVLRPLGEAWAALDAGSLATVRTEAETAAPGLVETVLQPLLDFPAALSFGIAYLVCRLLAALFGGRRRYRNAEPV